MAIYHACALSPRAKDSSPLRSYLPWPFRSRPLFWFFCHISAGAPLFIGNGRGNGGSHFRRRAFHFLYFDDSPGEFSLSSACCAAHSRPSWADEPPFIAAPASAHNFLGVCVGR